MQQYRTFKKSFRRQDGGEHIYFKCYSTDLLVQVAHKYNEKSNSWKFIYIFLSSNIVNIEQDIWYIILFYSIVNLEIRIQE